MSMLRATSTIPPSTNLARHGHRPSLPHSRSRFAGTEPTSTKHRSPSLHQASQPNRARHRLSSTIELCFPSLFDSS
ncbi:UNVERIFIED_CONTAM: hypothetical protein Sradi_3820900 [Sesamum radiatum]|uniref:Uncharacterized protein n=1 Tax=Sesamum radiatum TaxID=300843 RepID=A0AAW2Q0N8_SESRA